MIGVISPYELQPPTPGVCAALTLCDAVITLLPSPEGDLSPQNIDAAARQTPRFRQLIEAWQWTTPLWRAGLLRAIHNSETPFADVRDACRRIVSSPSLAGLAPLISATRFELESEYLDAICRDILRGGSDPSISIPLAAGLETFAARHDLTLFSTPAGSVAGRLESLAARPLFRVQIPMIAVPIAPAFETLRSTLSAQLTALRRVISQIQDQVITGAQPSPAALQALDQTQADYTSAFLSQRDLFSAIVRRTDRDARHSLFASLSCVAIDPDATLAAASRAALALNPRPQRAPAPAPAAAATALARPRSLAFHVRTLPWDV